MVPCNGAGGFVTKLSVDVRIDSNCDTPSERSLPGGIWRNSRWIVTNLNEVAVMFAS